jgi:hypothetical protein
VPRSCDYDKGAVGFYEKWAISGLAQRLLASQEDFIPYSYMVGSMNIDLIHLT